MLTTPRVTWPDCDYPTCGSTSNGLPTCFEPWIDECRPHVVAGSSSMVETAPADAEFRRGVRHRWRLPQHWPSGHQRCGGDVRHRQLLGQVDPSLAR